MELYVRFDKFDKDYIFDYQDFVYKARELIYFLETHNKNYTREQYYKILELKDLIDALEVIEK